MVEHSRYGRVAMFLHWGMALLIAANLALGWYAQGLGRSPRQLELFLWHKSLGLTVLGLALLRLGWRWLHPAPPVPAGLPAWQRLAARVSHVSLYVLMIAVPLAGWVLNSAANVPLRWFGLLEVPALLAPDRALREGAGTAHEILAWALAALAAVHVLAALWHGLAARDGVLGRMLPARGRP